MAKDKGNNAELQKRVQNTIAIAVLLGLSWLFGFLAIGGAQFIFNLLFLIFNSLQGFFVFVFFCLRNREVIKVWKEKFGRNRDSVSESQTARRSGTRRSSEGTVSHGNTTTATDTTNSSAEKYALQKIGSREIVADDEFREVV